MNRNNLFCRKSSERSIVARRGATAVEFAIIAPVLLAVIFSSFEFSRLSMLRSLAQAAAYEAARNVIVEGSTSQEARDEAERILSRLAAKDAIITINDGVEIDRNTPEIHVVIEIPMEKNTFFYSLPWFANRYVSAEITLRTERYNGYYDGGNGS